MKIYGTPENISPPKWPQPFSNEQYDQNCKDYKEAIKQWLHSIGYSGPRTGETLRKGVADGYAQYMYAEVPAGFKGQSFLVHIDEGDGYHYPDIGYLPKKEILRLLDQQKAQDAFWAEQKAK